MKKVNNLLLKIVLVCFLVFVLVGSLVSFGSAVDVTVVSQKSVNLTIQDNRVLFMVDNNVLLNEASNINLSRVFGISLSNTTSVNNTVLSVQVQNVTYLTNFSCDFNFTHALLFEINQSVNKSFFVEQFSKNRNDLQDFFYTNVKPVSDKLLDCGKELNDLKLQKGECLINASFFDNSLLAKNNEVKFNQQIALISGVSSGVLLILVVILILIVTNRASIKNLKEQIQIKK